VGTFGTALVALALPLVQTLAAQSPAAASPVDAAESGRRTFRVHCSSCHGSRAEGGRAPDLTLGGSRRSGDPDSELFRIISEGIPGTEMASYSARLDADDIRRIIGFLRSAGRQDSAVSGDPARGSAIFWGKGGCANCHAVGMKGSLFATDLTRIGRQRGTAYLRESLTAPSSDIAREYMSVTVVTKDGKTVRGIAKAVDDFSVVLQEPSGKVRSFDRSDARTVTRDTSSLMPEFGKILNETELTDVVAYLASLGRE
jgi:putative heme-binding domain-containing protein